jgi:hypothetical protein
MGKPDLGAFEFNKRDWKVTRKQPSYYKNFDSIFRKVLTPHITPTENVCGGKCDNCKCEK